MILNLHIIFYNDVIKDIKAAKIFLRDNKNPVPALQKQCNAIIKEFLNLAQIDLVTYKNLICHNGLIPKLYVLAKVHLDLLCPK